MTTGTAPRRISIETDPSRSAAWLLPLSAGRADLGAAVPLPATAGSDAVVVVAGRTAQKSDAPFTLRVEPVDAGADARAEAGVEAGSDTGSEAEPPAAGLARDENGGCACTLRPAGTSPIGAALLGLLVLIACTRRRVD